MIRLKSVSPLENYRVRVAYEDGTTGVVDVQGLVGRGVYQALAKDDVFRTVHRDDAHNSISWGDDIDISATCIYLRLTNEKGESCGFEGSVSDEQGEKVLALCYDDEEAGA